MTYIQVNDNTLKELRALMLLKYPDLKVNERDDSWIVSYVLDHSITALKNVADPLDSRLKFIEKAMGNAETKNLWKNIQKDF